MSTFLHALHAVYLFVEEDAVEVCKHAKKGYYLYKQLIQPDEPAMRYTSMNGISQLSKIAPF